MGLDIDISTDIDDDSIPPGFLNDNGLFYQHSLSRAFCNLVQARGAESKPTLDEIGAIAGVDISAIYTLDTYPQEEELQFRLSLVEGESEKLTLLKEAQDRRDALIGNIDIVYSTIQQLIESLGKVADLPSLLLQSHSEPSVIHYYYSDFLIDKGDGYIGNNLGHDLRNFRRFLEHSIEAGARTVWFRYG